MVPLNPKDITRSEPQDKIRGQSLGQAHDISVDKQINEEEAKF